MALGYIRREAATPGKRLDAGGSEASVAVFHSYKNRSKRKKVAKEYMAENEQESFTVTDRRLFTSDGELRKDIRRRGNHPLQGFSGAARRAASGPGACFAPRRL